MFKTKNLGLLIIIAAVISGCSTTGKNVMVEEADPAVLQLLEVAKDISAWERALYEVESARYLEGNKEMIGAFDMYFLPAMDNYYSLGDQWSGPIEPLIESISELAGLNPPRYLNVKPANSIIVHIDTNRRKLIDILADAGNQSRQRARVTLKMREKVIQVEYNND